MHDSLSTSREPANKRPFMKTPISLINCHWVCCDTCRAFLPETRSDRSGCREPEFQDAEAPSLVCCSHVPAPETPAGGQILPRSLRDLGQVPKPSEPLFLHLQNQHNTVRIGGARPVEHDQWHPHGPAPHAHLPVLPGAPPPRQLSRGGRAR